MQIKSYTAILLLQYIHVGFVKVMCRIVLFFFLNMVYILYILEELSVCLSVCVCVCPE